MDKTARLDEIVAAHAGRDGPLLPILHDIQAEFGCVDEEAKRHLAGALNLSRAEVHGVVSFYHDFKSEPAKLPVSEAVPRRSLSGARLRGLGRGDIGRSERQMRD